MPVGNQTEFAVKASVRFAFSSLTNLGALLTFIGEARLAPDLRHSKDGMCQIISGRRCCAVIHGQDDRRQSFLLCKQQQFVL